jgi:signal transduction histidine kinase
MQENIQRQSQIRVLPAFSVNKVFGLQETDMEEVVKTVQNVLLRPVAENVNITITLLEKNLNIMADMAIMKKALAHLVGDAIGVMPGCSKFLLTINQASFEIESLLNCDNAILGACAFISLPGGDTGIDTDGRIREKIREPFFTRQIDSNGLDLAIAYRILKEHHGRIKVESRVGQGTEVNIYLPLTKMEIVDMMSIPAG